MAWYLNEALTDLSILPKLLNAWSEDNTSGALRNFFAEADFNNDLIEDEDVPGDYEDIYEWLAYDADILLKNLGLVDSNNNLSNLGLGINSGEIELYKGLAAGLVIHWQDDNLVLFKFLDVLRRMREEDTKPFAGLVLPEAYLILKCLDDGGSIDDCFDMMQNNRSKSPDTAPGDILSYKEALCGYLLEHEEELTPINIVRTRAALIWFIATSFTIYGDLLEPIQHIEFPVHLDKKLEICKKHYQSNVDAVMLYNNLS